VGLDEVQSHDQYRWIDLSLVLVSYVIIDFLSDISTWMMKR
jgi:hypothetical protein